MSRLKTPGTPGKSRAKTPVTQKQEKYFSSDEEIWETPHEPVINAFSCGWLEDGRCGFTADRHHKIQLCPRPIAGLQRKKDAKGRQFVCKKASAGSRHTLFLMINYIAEKGRFGRKTKKIMFTGLNQGMLCEEEGIWSPEDVEWEDEEPPVDLVAGYGNCFVVSKSGNLFSFGLGKFGILGHGDEETWQLPRQVMSLQRHRVKQVALGKFHALCTTYAGKLFSWGRNEKGQLGRGHKSPMEVTPGLVADINTDREHTLDIACGLAHSLAIVRMKRRDNSVNDYVYGWGDYECGQLSSADPRNSHKPQNLIWVMKFLEKYEYTALSIKCGGFHNMLLVGPVRQVITWGGGLYGQLGDGFAWDNPRPQVVPNVKNVLQMSAGMRHSAVVAGVGGLDGIPDVWVWGDNMYGQLGLGDLDIRLSPTIMTACRRMRVTGVSAGDRHTVFVTSHKPLVARDNPMLRDFFRILEEGASRLVRHRLGLELKRNGMDASLLDDPNKVMVDQAGKSEREICNEEFEVGLKYCMDTRESLPQLQWRRKGLECAYECPALGLKAVCMACARRCVKSRKLFLYLRKRRNKSDVCDCRTSGNCTCAWTLVREKIDRVVEEAVDGRPTDGMIGPDSVRKVLVALRSPIPVDGADVEECLIALAGGEEDSHFPRIQPGVFERWYRSHFQEYEEDDV